jgi:hypothetical protein
MKWVLKCSASVLFFRKHFSTYLPAWRRTGNPPAFNRSVVCSRLQSVSCNRLWIGLRYTDIPNRMAGMGMYASTEAHIVPEATSTLSITQEDLIHFKSWGLKQISILYPRNMN